MRIPDTGWIGILLFALTVAGVVQSELRAADTGHIEPAPLQKIESNDSRDVIITKAAHVVPTPRQLAYHRREYIAFIHWGPNAFSRRE